MAAQTVLILDFGGQYKELIARRVRECGVYSIVKPGDISLDKIREIDPIGIILTGGPNSVYEKESPHCDKAIFDIGIPVLGICYGMQLLSWSLGGEVSPCSSSEYGRTKMQVSTDSPLFAGLDPAQIGLMSHTDQVTKLPAGFRSIAHTVSCENAAIENAAKKLYGFQFHPEVESTPNGTAMIRSFLYSVCGAKGDYDLKNLEQQLISDVKSRWAMHMCCLPFPAAWIPPYARRCFPRRCPASSTAYSWITVSCAKTRETRSRRPLKTAIWTLSA